MCLYILLTSLAIFTTTPSLLGFSGPHPLKPSRLGVVVKIANEVSKMTSLA